MRKRLGQIIVTVMVIWAGLVILSTKAQAQCTGNATCGSHLFNVCEDSGGNTCTPSPMDPSCVCNPVCGGTTENISCGNCSPRQYISPSTFATPT